MMDDTSGDDMNDGDYSEYGYSAYGDTFKYSDDLVGVAPEGDESRGIKHLMIDDYNYITNIPDEVFEEWETLQTITFSDTVISIGDAAFRYCTSLELIDPLPKYLERIGEYAFYSCMSLAAITFPPTLERIGDGAFESCYELLEIDLPESLIDMGESVFSSCKSLRKVEIPPSITSIKNATFYNCEAITKVNIPHSVTEIEHKAFQNCIALKSLKLNNTLETIDEEAFQGCESLESIQIPPSTTSIGASAFLLCTSLKIIYLPPAVIQEGNSFLDEFNPNIIILSNTERVVYESYPILSLYDIQQCLSNLPKDIPPSQQLHALHQALYQHNPSIAQRVEASGLTLLHLLVYFPNNIHQQLTDICNKCPEATLAMDNTGKTPLHHAILSTKHNMDTKCYDLLRERSPNYIVHEVIRSKSPWYDIADVVEADVYSLRNEDEVSGLLPFMMVAESSCDLDLTAVYKLLCLQPDVLKRFVPSFRRKGSSSSTSNSIDGDRKMKRSRIE